MLIRPTQVLQMLLLACACSHTGAMQPSLPPPIPQPPTIVTERGPCLFQAPPSPSPELLALPASGPLDEVQVAVLFTWIDVLEARVRRDWTICGAVAE